MPQHSAAKQLEQAFSQKPINSQDGMQTIGVFGDDVPLSVIYAQNLRPVCVKAASATQSASPAWLADYLEPFMDEYTHVFLSRLAKKEFQHLACLIFSRDDAAAFTAYQYANELYRQKLIPGNLPPLFLWNLTHTDTQPVHQFNCKQLDKLSHFLHSIGNHSGQQTTQLEDVIKEQRHHHKAIDRLHAACHQKDAYISGKQAFEWRNAGRWLDRNSHTQWLNEALDMSQDTKRPLNKRRIALVGGPVIDPQIHKLIESLGTIVSELHLFGELWPNYSGQQSDMPSMIRSIATDTRHPRTVPASQFPSTVLQQIQHRQCDLVVLQCSLNDDSFGWEIPRLCDALDAQSIEHLNLGLCPAYPDNAWFEHSRTLIQSLGNKAAAS